jgi:hypothetical protein
MATTIRQLAEKQARLLAELGQVRMEIAARAGESDEPEKAAPKKAAAKVAGTK